MMQETSHACTHTHTRADALSGKKNIGNEIASLDTNLVNV